MITLEKIKSSIFILDNMDEHEIINMKEVIGSTKSIYLSKLSKLNHDIKDFRRIFVRTGINNFLDKVYEIDNDNIDIADIQEFTTILLGDRNLSREFSSVLKDAMSRRNSNSEFVESLGISFLDKFESTYEHLVLMSKELIDKIDSINHILDVSEIALFIWNDYCHKNKSNLVSLLDNDKDNISNEIFKFIKRGGFKIGHNTTNSSCM